MQVYFRVLLFLDPWFGDYVGALKSYINLASPGEFCHLLSPIWVCLSVVDTPPPHNKAEEEKDRATQFVPFFFPLAGGGGGEGP